MSSCSEGHYLDGLLDTCIPCSVRCNANVKCASFCELHRCAQQAGHYYDTLVQSCVRCRDVCGQHPPRCNLYCQVPKLGGRQTPAPPAARLRPSVPKLGGRQTPAPPATRRQTSVSKLGGRQTPAAPATRLRPSGNRKLSCATGDASNSASLQLPSNHMLPTYCLLAVSLLLLLGVIIFILWRLLKSREQLCLSKPNKDGTGTKGLSKDHLVESGSIEGGSSESRSPQPVETCGLCFPEPTRNTCVGHPTPPYPYTATAVSTPYHSWGNGILQAMEQEDRPFKIICSPTQDKTIPS